MKVSTFLPAPSMKRVSRSPCRQRISTLSDCSYVERVVFFSPLSGGLCTLEPSVCLAADPECNPWHRVWPGTGSESHS
ncbi:hypothetical protein QQF64_022099 [Cirrhinus molitorella]|uniref:Uncharacterized protein n=1 Tax=Cirrhinus molitorella TaxID=172907 RepID=A0ABR3L772_9TELE